MKSEPGKLLNQLVVTALTAFIVVIMLLAALVLRQLWLQQRIITLSFDVRFNIDDLEKTTEEIQRELGEIETDSEDGNWQEIADALNEVDTQLDDIEEELNEVGLVIESTTDQVNTSSSEDQVDQVFTIFSVLISIASLSIAILLGIALNIQQHSPSKPLR